MRCCDNPVFHCDPPMNASDSMPDPKPGALAGIRVLDFFTRLPALIARYCSATMARRSTN